MAFNSNSRNTGKSIVLWKQRRFGSHLQLIQPIFDFFLGCGHTLDNSPVPNSDAKKTSIVVGKRGNRFNGGLTKGCLEFNRTGFS